MRCPRMGNSSYLLLGTRVRGKRMSREALPLSYTIGVGTAPQPMTPARAARSFVHHAKLISGLTLLSRILGVLRESLAAKYFGAGPVSTAFAVAFTIPN